MKTLHIIQTIAKIGQIISKIVFICCVVGFCICMVGIFSLAIGIPVIQLGGVTLENIFQSEGNMTMGAQYAAAITGAIICAGEAVLAKFASRYFAKELANGTPFTSDGAKELLRLGVLSIALPIAMQIVSQIAQTILTKAFPDTVPPDADIASSAAAGVLVLILSLVCRYGAEMNAENTLDEERL